VAGSLHFHLPRPADNEKTIAAELLAAQGRPVDLGGYYLPDDAMAARALRPSPAFNRIVDGTA
jgi:isocitrate dehydrogenase